MSNNKLQATFLEEAVKALNWQGGTKHQVLCVLSAARDVANERKYAELTGNYEELPRYLNALEDCFYT